MFRPWQSTLHISSSAASLLVTDPTHDLLKARLDPHPVHPRALLTLLEGLSLWRGQPLRVALCVDDPYRPGQALTLLGDDIWPADSALVQFDLVRRVRPKRLDGVGDFSQMRRLARQAGQ